MDSSTKKDTFNKLVLSETTFSISASDVYTNSAIDVEKKFVKYLEDKYGVEAKK
jgi:hypothetical protein